MQPFEWGGEAPFYGRLPLPAERTMEAWTADKTIELINGYTDSEQPFMIAAISSDRISRMLFLPLTIRCTTRVSGTVG